MSVNTDELANEMYSELEDADGFDADLEDIEEHVEAFASMDLPADEIRLSLAREYGDEDTSVMTGAGETTDALVGEIEEDGQWVDVEVRVERLFEDTHNAIAQKGVVGDESGTCLVTIWKGAELPEVEEGDVVAMTNVVTDEWQGNYNIATGPNTAFEFPDEEIEVGDDNESFVGPLIDLPGEDRNGLIKRCGDDDCTRVLDSDECPEHGDVDGDFDLRLQAVLDDGRSARKVNMSADVVEDLTGIDLDEAQTIAQEELDRSAPFRQMADQGLVGHYYEIRGVEMYGMIMANEIERLDETEPDGTLLDRAESLAGDAEQGDQGPAPADQDVEREVEA